MSEIHSLSKSLDIWKSVAEEAHSIHGEAARRREVYHDPEVNILFCVAIILLDGSIS